MDTVAERNEAIRVKLVTTIEANVELAHALTKARREIASLRAKIEENASLVEALLQAGYDLNCELAEVRETNTDLAALVRLFTEAHQSGNPAALDAAMAGVEVVNGGNNGQPA